MVWWCISVFKFKLLCSKAGEKNPFHSQRPINVIFLSVSDDDVQAERYEQTQPKAGSQICWCCNCWWIILSRAGKFPQGWPSQGKSVLLMAELINAGRTFRNVEAPGDFIHIILPVNAAASPFTARWGARAQGKCLVLRAGAAPRAAQPEMCQWDQFWDESGSPDHTFWITLPGTCCEISFWQFSFIRNRSGFLEKKSRGFRAVAFYAISCNFIHHWMN